MSSSKESFIAECIRSMGLLTAGAVLGFCMGRSAISDPFGLTQKLQCPTHAEAVHVKCVDGKSKFAIYPQQYAITNFIHSKICCKCGGRSDFVHGTEFLNPKIRPPMCPMLAVYPPIECEYPIIGTNITYDIKWVSE